MSATDNGGIKLISSPFSGPKVLSDQRYALSQILPELFEDTSLSELADVCTFQFNFEDRSLFTVIYWPFGL